MDYYALIEISELFDCEEDLVTKKLPKGSYISFEISFDNIRDEVERVYNFVKKEQINVHLGFDVEEYIPGQDYTKPGAKLYLTFKLDE
jgi:predicted transcriptional regulator YdeE